MIKNLSEKKGEEVVIKGWVDVARDQGKMAFFDFRDVSGKVQGVVFGKPDVLEVAKELRSEWVVSITGIVNERPEKMIKEGVLNGDIELEIVGIEVLNKAETPVFELDKDTREVNEETRLKYRYLDIRTERMKNNLVMRDKIISFFRNHMHNNGFTEIEKSKKFWKSDFNFQQFYNLKTPIYNPIDNPFINIDEIDFFRKCSLC